MLACFLACLEGIKEQKMVNNFFLIGLKSGKKRGKNFKKWIFLFYISL